MLFLPRERCWGDLPLDLALYIDRYCAMPPEWLWPVRSLPPGGENSTFASHIRAFRNYSITALAKAMTMKRRKLRLVKTEVGRLG